MTTTTPHPHSFRATVTNRAKNSGDAAPGTPEQIRTPKSRPLLRALPLPPRSAPPQRGGGGARLRRALQPLVLAPLFVLAARHFGPAATANTSKSAQGASEREACLRHLRRHNAAYLRQNIRRFWGSGDYIEVLLMALGKEQFAREFDVFVDVGAGSYGEKGGDISLSFIFDAAFPAEEKTVLAFEPFPGSYERLTNKLAEYRAKHGRDDRSLRYILRNVGCGMSNQTMLFRGQRSFMTANRRIALHPWYSGKVQTEIESTTVDIATAEAGVGSYVNVLKTDTEGLELEVLLGARRLLQERQIDLIVYAYEDKWNWDSFEAAYPLPGWFVKDQLAFDTPNLRSVSTWLDGLGYKSYLIGSANRGREKSFVALPVTAEYWDDAFEVARDPKGYGVHPTWMDAIAVKDGSTLQDWIERRSSSHIRVSCP